MQINPLINSLNKILYDQSLIVNSIGTGTSFQNPANQALSTSFSVQISGMGQALSNTENSVSLLNEAQSGASQINSSLQQINTLIVQAGNSTLSASDKSNIQSQINQYIQNIDQIANNLQFNGVNILNNSQTLSFQTGPNQNDITSIQTANLTSQALGISNINIMTPAGQNLAINSIQNAFQTVNNANANFGSMSLYMQNLTTFQIISQDNLAAANSQISDTNYANALTNLLQTQIQAEAVIKAINIGLSQEKTITQLIP
jgi:flagellin